MAEVIRRTAAPMASVGGLPISLANEPTMRLPMGKSPMNAQTKRLITRPLICVGAISCSDVLIEDVVVRNAIPIPTCASNEMINTFENAKTRSRML